MESEAQLDFLEKVQTDQLNNKEIINLYKDWAQQGEYENVSFVCTNITLMYLETRDDTVDIVSAEFDDAKVGFVLADRKKLNLLQCGACFRLMAEAGYLGPQMVTEFLHKYLSELGFDKNSPLLDVGAGTGLCGQILRDVYGYTSVDAVDGTQEMLDKAKEKNLYRKYICSLLGDGHMLDIPDNYYTAALMVGCLGGGHIKYDVFLELIRIVKPGGLIVSVMREEVTRKVPEYTNLKPFCRSLEQEGKWKCLEETIPVGRKYYKDYDALVHVFQML